MNINTLIDLIYNNDFNKIKELDISKVINSTCKDGKTPLMHASIVGNSDIVKYLVNQGANINAVDNSGYTSAMYAAKYLNDNVMIYLFKGGFGG